MNAARQVRAEDILVVGLSQTSFDVLVVNRCCWRWIIRIHQITSDFVRVLGDYTTRWEMAEEKKIDDDGEIVIKVRDMRKLGGFMIAFGTIAFVIGLAPWDGGWGTNHHFPTVLFGGIAIGLGSIFTW